MRKGGVAPRGSPTTGRKPASGAAGKRAGNVVGNPDLRKIPNFIQNQPYRNPLTVELKGKPDARLNRAGQPVTGLALRMYSRGIK